MKGWLTGELGGGLKSGADEKDVVVAGSAALVAFIDLFDESFPSFGGEEFGGFPFLRIFFFSLPANDTGEKGDAVGYFRLIALGLVGPFHATAHGE